MTRAEEWQGPVGDVWASEWERTDRSFAGLAPSLDAAILAAAPPGDFTALDIGCGAGATALALAEARPDAQVTGVDLSPALIAIAEQRRATLPNLAFVSGDAVTCAAQVRPDLLCSRHGVMFFDDPVVSLRALRDAAAPGATLVFSCFRAAALNPWAAEIGVAVLGAPAPPPSGYAPGPFAFADPDFVRVTLAFAGWHAADPVAVDFHYRAGGGVDPVADAVDFFGGIGPAAPVLRAADPATRAAMITRITDVVARYRRDDVVDFPAAAWLWTVKA